jgi:CDP-diacylglycerol--serine O-phosphatidyltransferase
MPRRSLLPNLITLGNAFCGVLALSKGIDALTLSAEDPGIFYRKMESACFFVFLGMLFDALDGLAARMTGGGSAFGAQLDSFSDALTFGVVPAMLAKILVEHESAPGTGNPRLHFLVAATFALMAILRLVRFNLDPGHEPPRSAEGETPPAEAKTFTGLPSPGAAGAVIGTLWIYLILQRPELEREEGTPTWLHRMLGMQKLDWSPFLERIPDAVVVMLPLLGLLMVSNLRYVHGLSYVLSRGGQFFTLVSVVIALILFLAAPVPLLFLFFLGFAASGPVRWLIDRVRERRAGTP